MKKISFLVSAALLAVVGLFSEVNAGEQEYEWCKDGCVTRSGDSCQSSGGPDATCECCKTMTCANNAELCTAN